MVADYSQYAVRFKSAIRALAEARAKVGPPTPREVVHYWNFQCWRVLANWLSIISALPREERIEANRDADTFVGRALATAGLANASDLAKAMNSAEAAIPNGHPYRALIEFERER